MMAGKMCPACNKELKLRESGYPMGSAFLKADRVHVDIYECPDCHEIKLFASDGDMMTCPKCGTLHNVKEACPVCALNAAFDGANK
ncbi:MAG: hypothetical protein IJ859_11680 [Synergistaceae bacterium]|nr:hypothetical protein [Synergistaceae bacterium]